MQTSSFTRYALRLSYHGLPFSGWQVQPAQRTVQGELEKALSTLLREQVKVLGAGRTDSGVHAANYVAHVDVATPLDVKDTLHRLDRFLPTKIAVHEMVEITDRMHARFSAESRSYRYVIRRKQNPFGADMVWTHRRDMDFSLLKRSAEILLSQTEFAAFARTGSPVKTTLCNITHASWHQEGEEWVFQIRGNRFLRNMVRSLVGTMVELAQGQRDWDNWLSMFDGATRCDAGQSAPAKGLSFVGVTYPDSPFQSREHAPF